MIPVFSRVFAELCSVRMFRIAIVCLPTLLIATSDRLQAEEIVRWEFDSPEHGWSANDQVDQKVENGQLLIVAKGADPQLTSKMSGKAGHYQVTIRAQFEGRSRFQLFWTTAKHPETSESRTAEADWSGNGKEMKAFRVWFESDEPVTSLRIDPLHRAGEISIDSIIVTDDEPPKAEATPLADIRVKEGFQVELLHSVLGEAQGSWVSMTTDPKGRLIVSDQYGGLYRITPPAVGSSEKILIESVKADVGMAHGLLYAFDSLYLMNSGPEKENQGLYRIRDTDGDDQFDSVEHLRHLEGGGEHGPHAIILSPDGKSLHICAGNHTPITEFVSSRVPRIWGEDQLLPRMWDAGGHAVGILAPGGWIAKVSPDGKEWELVSSGYRNQYDIAFSPEGELFTYDADMEWDVGSPWYRPTRVNHATSGSEFGWRSGTGKWPVYYPDSLGSVVDIGPGCPTGITFGTGAAFPAAYQKSLFIADWSYGVIYAVHLTPDGSSYRGEAERFVSAAPLPVTDIVINPKDKAMYFTIGGRRTQSGLYRVTYRGTESTASTKVEPDNGTEQRKIRRSLEALHVAGAPNAVDTAWKYLGHPDRAIRFAARTAIEHQPVATWQQRALSESSGPDATITALLALARCGDKSQQRPLIQSLASVHGSSLSEEQRLAAIRVLGLCFIRMGQPDPDFGTAIADVLTQAYPSKSIFMNRELCRMLVYLNDSEVAGKTLALMDAASTQEEQIHYAYCLRALSSDKWTIEQKARYFEWFLKTANLRGGHSFSGFIKNIRQEAIDRLTDKDREALKAVLEKAPTPAEPMMEAASRPFVKEWKVDDLLADLEAGLKDRNFENGRKMFTATACFRCHRFAGDGGVVGPDLTAVGRRYNARTMLESLIEPSKVISDQYEAKVFVLASGKQVTGRVVNLGGDDLMVSENMLDPGRLTNVRRSEIEESFVSKTSMMPAGLLNNLTKDEILDLIAYLQSGGDPNSAVFSGKRVASGK